MLFNVNEDQKRRGVDTVLYRYQRNILKCVTDRTVFFKFFRYLKVNNKITPFSRVSIANFDQVNASWDRTVTHGVIE